VIIKLGSISYPGAAFDYISLLVVPSYSSKGSPIVTLISPPTKSSIAPVNKAARQIELLDENIVVPYTSYYSFSPHPGGHNTFI